ncbi:MAG: transposase [Planctomycetota bacterium]
MQVEDFPLDAVADDQAVDGDRALLADAVGTIDRCIREVGVACEPIVEELLEEVRASGLIHADETPWYQGKLSLWLWVLLTATTAVFHIGSRRHEEIRNLLGDAMVGCLNGWIVSDGYHAYRDYPRHQRCLAHLIRKGLALAGGLSPDGVHNARKIPLARPEADTTMANRSGDFLAATGPSFRETPLVILISPFSSRIEYIPVVILR